MARNGPRGCNDILKSVRILLATTNQGKIAEVSRIMGERLIEVAGLVDSASTDDIETGSTFAENALLKARYYHRISRVPTIADDSGLEVEALGGAPGVYSARYAGPGAGDAGRIAKLLDEMKGLADQGRRARFTCACACTYFWISSASAFASAFFYPILFSI